MTSLQRVPGRQRVPWAHYFRLIAHYLCRAAPALSHTLINHPSANEGFMLAYRLRHWPSIKPSLAPWLSCPRFLRQLHSSSSSDSGSMLAHRLRRWANINPYSAGPSLYVRIWRLYTIWRIKTIPMHTESIKTYIMAVDPQHRYPNESERAD